jgi:GTP:adenosylcobinamide-phosphate guanylyltransferase
MNVVVIAGGQVQPKEPLYPLTGGGLKTMMKIAGKPMVQWVLDALCRSSHVEQIVIVGLPPEAALDSTKPCIMLSDQGEMLGNIQAGARELARIDPAATHALLVSGDLPALRPGMIDWLVRESRDQIADVYYTVIQRETMEAAFPGSRRTYLRLKDMEVCGGDCHCFRIGFATEENALWRRLLAARKNPLRQASIVGYDTLFFLLLRQMGLSEAEQTASRKLGINGRAILSPFPEMGMDVDKPYQFEMLSEYLERQKPAIP